MLGCATPEGLPVSAETAALPESAAVSAPFFAGEAYQCGPAALAMALAWSGVDAQPASLAAEVFVPARKGSFAIGLVAAARAHGRVPVPIETLAELLAELAAGHPVLVLQDLGLRAPLLSRPHFALAVGYDLASRELALHSGDIPRRGVAFAPFVRTWERAGGFAVSVLPPDVLPAVGDAQRWLGAASGLEQAGRWPEAERAYRTAIGRWPDHAGAWLALGNAALAQGRLGEAEEAFRRATALDPGAAAAWNNLAHTLAARGRPAEARAAARRALALGGPHAAIAQQTLDEIDAASGPE